MNIKHAFRTILVGVVSVLFFISFHACKVHHPEKPNVLFIFVDDMRTQLGCYGNFQMKTPHLPFNAPKAYWDLYEPSTEMLPGALYWTVRPLNQLV